jgi:hypothetical protein
VVRDSGVGFVVEQLTEVLRIRDPLFDSGIPIGKKSIPDDISERLEAVFWVKILKIL